MSYSINLNKNINPDTLQRLRSFVFISTFLCYQTKSEVRKCAQIFYKHEARIAKGENDIYCSSIVDLQWNFVVRHINPETVPIEEMFLISDVFVKIRPKWGSEWETFPLWSSVKKLNLFQPQACRGETASV